MLTLYHAPQSRSSRIVWLLGEKFSGADVLIASMGQFVRQMLPAGAVVDAYLERCNRRPALARAGAKDGG